MLLDSHLRHVFTLPPPPVFKTFSPLAQASFTILPLGPSLCVRLETICIACASLARRKCLFILPVCQRYRARSLFLSVTLPSPSFFLIESVLKRCLLHFSSTSKERILHPCRQSNSRFPSSRIFCWCLLLPTISPSHSIITLRHH